MAFSNMVLLKAGHVPATVTCNPGRCLKHVLAIGLITRDTREQISAVDKGGGGTAVLVSILPALAGMQQNSRDLASVIPCPLHLYTCNLLHM